ncbi:MAG TPA: hypothetical protein EYG86_03955 [Crocinitomicaceae bacterium]|nr:hypothetical protein [Crocinitomicaceae bacterium]
MKAILKHIVIFCFTISPILSVANSTFQEAVGAFNQEKYELSAEKFDSIISISPDNISAYFNYGLAKMQTKNYGEAIWGFQKVLKLRPSDLEAKEKIQECYLELNPNHYWKYRLNGFQASLYSISANTWGVFTVLCAVLIAASIVLFKLNKSHSTRRLMLVIGVISSLFFVFSILFGALTNSYVTSNNYAIVTSKNAESIHDKVKLSEGDFVEIIGEDSEEIRVRLEEGEMISLKEEDIRRI